MGGTFTARPWKRHCRHKVWAASCFDAYPKCHWLNPLSFRNIPSWVPHVCRLYLTTIAFIYLYISLSYSQKKPMTFQSSLVISFPQICWEENPIHPQDLRIVNISPVYGHCPIIIPNIYQGCSSFKPHYVIGSVG